MRWRAAQHLVRHAYLVWRAGQLRFRLETFGLYYPTLPYTAPWWRAPRRNAIMLVRQASAYARWVVEMEEIRQRGPTSWWDGRRGLGKDVTDDR